MADLILTASSVIAQAGATIDEGIAGESVSQGQALYQDASDSNSLKGAQHDDTQASAEFKGIALNAAADGQPVKYVSKGPVSLGAVLTAGAVYAVGAAPGGIAPVADPGTADYMTVIGVATSASVLNVDPIISGVQLA